MRFASTHSDGFTLVDLLVVTALIGILTAISIPVMTGAMERMRLGQAGREVERELQSARTRAVSKGRPMRVRFNCPTAGEFRAVELIGSISAPAAADNAANRCSLASYPYPSADNDPVTRPNLDGPLGRLESAVTITVAPEIEFWPDGTAHYNAGGVVPWPIAPGTGLGVSLKRGTKTSIITVNGSGRIRLQTTP